MKLIYQTLIGLNIIFSGIGIQFKTIETKNLNFKQISIIDIIAVLLSLVIAVILAVKGYGVFSLVYSSLAQYLLSNTLYLILGIKKHGLLFHYRFSETLPFLKIGIYQVGGQIVNYFNPSVRSNNVSTYGLARPSASLVRGPPNGGPIQISMCVVPRLPYTPKS